MTSSFFPLRLTFAAALAWAGTTLSAAAGDVYVCETVLFCNDAGQCVEIEICDVVEGIIAPGLRLGGGFDPAQNLLKLSGLPRALNGQSISIPKGARFSAPARVKPLENLVGRGITPGNYRVDNGSLALKIGR